MTFQEVYVTLPDKGWLTEDEARLLHAVAASVGGPILEVGCYHGRSTVLLASFGRRMYCVDPFAGFDSDDPTGRRAKRAWTENVARAVGPDGSFVELHVSRVEDWPEEPEVGLAYLDGDHTRAGTLAQVRKAISCRARVIVAHDVNDDGGGLAVKRACLELLGEWTDRVGRLAVWVRDGSVSGDRP